MKTIPEIRERMKELGRIMVGSSDHFLPEQIAKWGEELQALAEATKRRPAVRRTGSRLAFTEEKRIEVLQYVQQFPDASYHEIAIALNVNTARISEAVSGKRGLSL